MRIESYIDSTLLKPDATEGEILRLCRDAERYKLHSVCINPTYVATAKYFLVDPLVRICSVVGFPLGANTTKVKCEEAYVAMRDGANEIDVVMDIGKFKNRLMTLVERDLTTIVRMVDTTCFVKVIIECGLLSQNETEIACKIIMGSGAEFVKTSTGFLDKVSITLEDVITLKKIVGNKLKIKGAGGIKSYDYAIAVIKAGADRIGTSSAVEIIKQYKEEEM